MTFNHRQACSCMHGKGRMERSLPLWKATTGALRVLVEYPGNGEPCWCQSYYNTTASCGWLGRRPPRARGSKEALGFNSKLDKRFPFSRRISSAYAAALPSIRVIKSLHRKWRQPYYRPLRPGHELDFRVSSEGYSVPRSKALAFPQTHQSILAFDVAGEYRR